jgi:hypothetical protein
VRLLFIFRDGCVRSGQGDFDQLIGPFETADYEENYIMLKKMNLRTAR